MAGETEDCISFQADCLPTGSVSFGRFELETLSWERRSSFSHNRYLEEVEKYSTPGSVTQKRAILEAHFKKKPLLPQTSLENLYDGGFQTTENGSSHHRSIENEFEDHNDGGDPEFDQYDEMLTGSDQHEIVVCEQGEFSPTESLTEPTRNSDERIIDHTSLLIKDDLCTVAEQEPDNKAVIVEELLEKKETVIVEIVEKRDIPSESPVVEKKSVTNLKKKTQTAPLRGRGVQQKTTKAKQKNLPIRQNLWKSSVERGSIPHSKILANSKGKLEMENPLRTKSVKQLPLRTSKPTDSKNIKLETSTNMGAKVRQGSRREKNVKAKKAGSAPHLSSGRSEIDIVCPANRPKKVSDSTNKEGTRQNGAVFSFRSDERAEKRKEYFLKLEEKLHVKEAEMSEIQARTKEETEAAIRQLRRSLNFKATPMPSFYHGVAPRISEGKKKFTTPAKPSKVQSKCTSPVSQNIREKSPSVSNATNIESQSNSDSNHASSSAKSTETGKRDKRNKPKIRSNSS